MRKGPSNKLFLNLFLPNNHESETLQWEVRSNLNFYRSDWLEQLGILLQFNHGRQSTASSEYLRFGFPMRKSLSFPCIWCNLNFLPPDNLESDSVSILIFTQVLGIETSSCSEFFRRKASVPAGRREGEPFWRHAEPSGRFAFPSTP